MISQPQPTCMCPAQGACRCQTLRHYSSLLDQAQADPFGDSRDYGVLGALPAACGHLMLSGQLVCLLCPPREQEVQTWPYAVDDPFATDPALYDVADLEAMLAVGEVSHVGPTELTWKPLRKGHRLGELRDDEGLLGVMSLSEAGRAYEEQPIRVKRQNLTCLRHPISCDLKGALCDPEVTA